MQELPLEPSNANYSFGTVLDGLDFTLDVRWNSRDEAWYLNLRLPDDTLIALGMKVVLGGPIGIPHRATDQWPPGLFLAMDVSGQNRDATFDDIGTRVRVFYIPYDEVVA